MVATKATKKKTLRALSHDRIAGHYRRHYQLAASLWAGGDNRIEVVEGATPDARSSTRKVWSRNGKWSGTDLRARIVVSPTWRTTVEGRGLAVLDGLLTTHARLLRRFEGIEVYRASWVRQGRGLQIRGESGVVAVHRPSGGSYHLLDGEVNKAVAGLRRKLRALAVPEAERDERRRRRQGDRRERLGRLVDRLARGDLREVSGVEVRREDSIKAGNCGPGTDEFIDRFFAGRSHATMTEIAVAVGNLDLKSLDATGVTLAYQIAAACLVAIRRDKRNRRESRRGVQPPQD